MRKLCIYCIYRYIQYMHRTEANEMKYLLEVDGVSGQIEDFKLEDIRFWLEPGYILGIIGGNGTGKSTLLGMILGFYRPSCGNIRIDGFDRVNRGREAKALMGCVMENCPFPMTFSPLENAGLFGGQYQGFDRKSFREHCRRFEVDMKRPLCKLSRGMVIKFQLAFALAHHPRLLVMDEPLSGLDPVFRREFMGLLSDILSEETGIIMASHMTEELEQIGDYILMLHKSPALPVSRQAFFASREELDRKYLIIEGSERQLDRYRDRMASGVRAGEYGCSALIYRDLGDGLEDVRARRPLLEDFMYFFHDAMILI